MNAHRGRVQDGLRAMARHVLEANGGKFDAEIAAALRVAADAIDRREIEVRYERQINDRLRGLEYGEELPAKKGLNWPFIVAIGLLAGLLMLIFY